MKKHLLLAGLLSAAFTTAANSQSVDHPDCSTILPPDRLPPGTRALVPEDLVRLRDIGPVQPQYFAEPFFTLSPDQRWLAFQLRQADPQRNAYCLAMVILDLSKQVPPRIVDEGGNSILFTFDFRGIAGFPIGILSVITPRWSADGKWIAFLKNSGATTQVWRAFADGSGSAPLTHADTDVVDFQIAADGSSIVYATRPGIQRQEAEIEKEGLNGWHYDERFVPFDSKRPLPKMPVKREIAVLDVVSGKVRAPTDEEAALVSEDNRVPATAGAAQATGNDSLEIAATDFYGGAKAGSFHAHLTGRPVANCTAEACAGAVSPWLMPDKSHVRYFRREGWAKASTAIYDWDLQSGDVRRLYLTDDLLSSCTPAGGELICRIDSSLEPGRLVKLDPVTGRRETLFDPNPEFAHLTLGRPERLHWTTPIGSETIADLVLPVGYRPGQKYPLVVVQYDTRGFLRGGTDDEYPIQAFANRGYAVLSLSSPAFPVEKLGAKNWEEAGRLELENFAGRRNIESAVERGVQIAIERGIADPKRLGITGLSDGSSTVEWAILHSKLFSAAAASSCCWDSTFLATVGPSAAKHFLAEGYPGILGRNDPFWKQVSISDNARRITTPLLINASEEEFLDTLITYTALREAGVPVDLFEYPGEYHARWQPAHRLATFKRSLDWFDYWLRGVRSDDPLRRPELDEWDRLKREGGHGHPI